jgi:hypothetical protein
MVDTPADVAEHLELLARELHSYGTVESRIVPRADTPPYLRVTSKEPPGLTETITCEITVPEGTVIYLWSWGQEIRGATLTEKARYITHVLHADPHEDDFRG